MSQLHNDVNSGQDLYPSVCDFQLIGDSQFVRFSEQILSMNRSYSNGINHVGLCICGQRICDLLERVEARFYPTSRRAVLMIGTNDLLKKTPVNVMCRDLENLVLKLIEGGTRFLILLTIPPVALLAKKYDHWSRLKEYNSHIKSLRNDEDIFVVDAYSKFVKRTFPQLNLGCNFCFFGGDVEMYLDRRYSDGSCERDNCSSPTSVKRGRPLTTECQRESPPSKRKLYNYILNPEAHENPIDVEKLCTTHQKADPVDYINFSLFEECFCGDEKRTDLIHLNREGLQIIAEVVSEKIEEIRETFPPELLADRIVDVSGPVK